VRFGMNEARVQLKLHWICPGCGTQHGLRGDPIKEPCYINGPLTETPVCRTCRAVVALKPARKDSNGNNTS